MIKFKINIVLFLFISLILSAVIQANASDFTDETMKKAQQGDVEAQISLGKMYLFGTEDIPQDQKEALKYFHRAANQGNIEAEYMVGLTLFEKDSAQAAAWFRKAANKGHDDAQNFLGVLYYNGEGVPLDYKKALYWYNQSAQNGNDSSQFMLGLMYLEGHGVTKDNKQAVYWLEKAARQGHYKAQGRLGLIYFYGGKGVLQDYVKSHAWLNLSAAAEDAPEDALNFARRVREMAESKMTPAQIAEAQKLARELKPKED